MSLSWGPVRCAASFNRRVDGHLQGEEMRNRLWPSQFECRGVLHWNWLPDLGLHELINFIRGIRGLLKNRLPWWLRR